MNKIILLIGLTIIYTSDVYSQLVWGKPKDIKAISERTLVVVTEDINDALVKKLEKKGTSQKYIDCVKNSNKALIEGAKAAKSSFHGPIKVMTGSEFDAITKSKKRVDTYAYVRLYGHTKHWLNAAKSYDSRDGKSTRSLTISLSEKSIAVYPVWLPFYEPSKADIIFGFQQIGIYFEMRTASGKEKKEYLSSINDNSQLSKKTLLLDKAIMKSVPTTESIKSAYPYKFKLVNRAFIDQQIESRSAEYIYLQVLPHLITQDYGGFHNDINMTGNGSDAIQAFYDYYQFIYATDTGEIVGHTGEHRIPKTFQSKSVTYSQIQNIAK